MRHILFRDGATRSGEVVYIDPARWEAPPNTLAIEFPPELGKQPLDYILQEGALVYSPEPEPEPAPLPNIDGFTNAIWEHPSLKPLRLNLVSFKGLIQEYIRVDAARIIEAWTEDIYPSLPDYDPQTQTSAAGDLVELLAAQNSITLR